MHPDNTAAVLAAAAQLGFTPNPAAQALARGRSNSIALIVPETDMDDLSGTFFTSALRGVIRQIAHSERQLVMLLRENRNSDDKFLSYLKQSRVDGLMVILETHNADLPELLHTFGTPTVYMGRPTLSDTLALSYVDADNEAGGRSAAAAMIAANRRSIGIIAGPASMGVTQDRLRGFVGELGRAGIHPVEIVHSTFLTPGGAEATQHLLATHPHIDGLFIMSDLMSAGALQILRETGRNVPEDVAIVSFDDSVVATALHPALTTVRQPLEELGALMVQTLETILDEGSTTPHRALLPTTLVRRESL